MKNTIQKYTTQENTPQNLFYLVLSLSIPSGWCYNLLIELYHSGVHYVYC